MALGTYTWLPVATAVQQLAQRLNDPTYQFWTYNELLTYISTSLRQFNSLTWMWRADFQYNDPVNIWNSLGSLPGSPRLRTITDQQVYAELEYMLLEPSNNTSTWTGTSQFNISVMSQALTAPQRRDDSTEQLQPIPTHRNTSCSEHNQDRTTGFRNRRRARPLSPSLSNSDRNSGIGSANCTVSSIFGIVNGQLVYGTGIATGTTVTGVGIGTVNISIPTSGWCLER